MVPLPGMGCGRPCGSVCDRDGPAQSHAANQEIPLRPEATKGIRKVPTIQTSYALNRSKS